MRATAAGMTLIEVLVTIAIVSVLVAVASPSFTEVVRLNRLDASTLDLRAALDLARSEAIKRAGVVVVEPIPAGNWTGVLRVYVDTAQNPANNRTGADPIVRQFDAMTGMTTTGGPARIAFDRRGNNMALVVGGNPIVSTISFCKSPNQRALQVDRAGFMTTSDGSC
ncbi:MAG: GspH/FimT family pseudopilin [Burkholderiaceae bacterium]